MEVRKMKELKRVSRWISIKTLCVTHKHSLAFFGDDMECIDGYKVVDAFRWKNRWYAVGQFIGRFSMWGFDRECERYPSYIHAYDGDGDIYNPLLMEINEDGTAIRLYLEV
jgi:hypothetical protein